MTLVLSEVSYWGVAMAADSAVTFLRPDQSHRIYIGAQKLLPVPQIDAGMSLWGKGCINDTDADVWLQSFIENQVTEDMGLWSMANELADSLNRAFGGVIQQRMGIHVCGFDEYNGVRGPALYHVHNGHYHVGIRQGQVLQIPDEDPPIREFRAHDDHRPTVLARDDPVIGRRNGDISLFAFLNDFLNSFFARIGQDTTFQFPYPAGLATRGEYLRFWINMSTEIYRLSNARPRILRQPATAGDASIGGPVTVLTISESGIESFYTR